MGLVLKDSHMEARVKFSRRFVSKSDYFWFKVILSDDKSLIWTAQTVWGITGMICVKNCSAVLHVRWEVGRLWLGERFVSMVCQN